MQSHQLQRHQLLLVTASLLSRMLRARAIAQMEKLVLKIWKCALMHHYKHNRQTMQQPCFAGAPQPWRHSCNPHDC